MKKIAVYARKSKFSEKGESVQNQIDIVKDYCKKMFDVDEGNFAVFCDEGFTGGNTMRPQFQKMLKQIDNFSHIAVYRLDRISRNIADFSAFILQLDKLGISFISVKEQFDTSTPMGRAMMFISSVFAQLERETISERIVDNMTGLTATGRYLAGKAPDGYVKQQKIYKDKNDALKKYNMLELNEERAYIIRDIFQKYTEWESINEIYNFYLNNNIKNSENNFFTVVGIRRILTNPVYAPANMDMYGYFENMGCSIMTDIQCFDGKYGITVYRRHKNITNTYGNKQTISRQPENWIIYVGFHPPMVSSQTWLKAQEILRKNARGKRQSIGLNGVFSGILHCGLCGDYMRPSNVTKNGFYYICQTKAKTHKKSCCGENMRGDILDKQIIINIHNMLFDKDIFNKFNKSENRAENITNIIKKNKQKIENYVYKLGELQSSEISCYLEQEITQLHNENIRLEKFLLTNDRESDNEDVLNMLAAMPNTLQEMSAKRALFKSVVSEIIWQESSAEIKLNVTDI